MMPDWIEVLIGVGGFLLGAGVGIVGTLTWIGVKGGIWQ